MELDVRTESPFWLMKSGYLEVYSAISEDISVDFAIKGGGISGALQAWHLSNKGASVALVDRDISEWAALAPVLRFCNTTLINLCTNLLKS